jgi:pimeloyl-ACP methyl ester carboxylesterase
MARFVLIPGAGGEAWYWHRVVPLLQAAQHEAIAVDLPGDDEQAGLDAYAQIVSAAMGPRDGVILVAHSLGGFTVPLVCARHHVDMLVFVNAMLPEPGESAEAWGDNTGSAQARKSAAKKQGYSPEFDDATYFFHDVPADLVRESASHQRAEAPIAFSNPCRFDAWPSIPKHVLVGKHDRLFPEAFQARVARERLHLGIETLTGGHLLMLSNPQGLAERLLAYAPA